MTRYILTRYVNGKPTHQLPIRNHAHGRQLVDGRNFARLDKDQTGVTYKITTEKD